MFGLNESSPFSCAPYKKIDRRNGDVSVEFYLYEHLEFQRGIADHVLNAIELYQKYFGPSGIYCYRIAASGVFNASPIFGGGENKGNAVFLSDDRMISMLENKDEISVLFHEVFHNYNLFYLF